VTVAAMAQLNLNIHDARILTSTSQFTLDTYIVLAQVERRRAGAADSCRVPDRADQHIHIRFEFPV
jgi:[protein-PII] uridylyltransferase